MAEINSAHYIFFRTPEERDLLWNLSCKWRKYILTIMENVTPCSPEDICWRFGKTCFLHFRIKEWRGGEIANTHDTTFLNTVPLVSITAYWNAFEGHRMHFSDSGQGPVNDGKESSRCILTKGSISRFWRSNVFHIFRFRLTLSNYVDCSLGKD